MRRICDDCETIFDDEDRWTVCPHNRLGEPCHDSDWRARRLGKLILAGSACLVLAVVCLVAAYLISIMF